MLVLNLPALANKKYTAYDRLQGNGPYGEIPTKKEPIRTLGFALPYNRLCYFLSFSYHTWKLAVGLTVGIATSATKSVSVSRISEPKIELSMYVLVLVNKS